MTHLETFSPDVAAAARSLLRTSRIGRALQSHQTVSSTNTLAAEWAEDGAPDGAVVYAEYQTEGRGRMGRIWQARRGLNLTFSVVLRPALPSDRLGLIGIGAGLAVAEALERFCEPLHPSIKWPNDVLLNGRKCSGILLETRWSSGGQPAAVILGIGINVNEEEFPPELENRATSILLETGRRVPREDVLASVLNALETRLVDLMLGAEGVRHAYAARMAQLNRSVRLRFSGGRIVAGVAAGLDESGGLVLDTAGGREIFHAGEVTHIP